MIISAASVDGQIDTIAIGVARIIIKKPERDIRESSAWVFRDKDGVLRATMVKDGNRFDVGDFTLQQYGVPGGASLVAFVHSHPTRNADDQPLDKAQRANNFDMNAIARADLYAQTAFGISVDVAIYRGYTLVPKSVEIKYDGGGLLQKYLRSNHLGPFDISTGKTIVYDSLVPDASFSIT